MLSAIVWLPDLFKEESHSVMLSVIAWLPDLFKEESLSVMLSAIVWLPDLFKEESLMFSNKEESLSVVSYSVTTRLI